MNQVEKRRFARNARKNAPRKIGDLLSDYLRAAGLDEIEQARKMADAWKRSVSEKVFESTRLIRVREGVIHVGVTSSALLFELEGFLKQEILTRFRQNQTGYIRDLRFKLESSEIDD